MSHFIPVFFADLFLGMVQRIPDEKISFSGETDILRANDCESLIKTHFVHDYGLISILGATGGWAVRYALTAQPVRSNPRPMQSTNCSCFVKRLTASNII